MIDIWAEPRDVDGLPFIIRARIRDIGTNEEHYVGSWAEAERLVATWLDLGGISPRRWERP